MKKLSLIALLFVLIFASCSKDRKINKILWKPEGTWTVTTSSYAYYSMGTYNTSTGKYEDSTLISSGDFTGSTYQFEKFDKSNYEGDGSFTTSDTTINFVYFASEDIDFNTGKPNGEYTLVIENDPPAGGTSQQEFYDIISYDKTKMSLEQNDFSGWSTTPYDVIHSYISFEMEK